MEARDFIYHFTDILFYEIVKETILIENWEGKDFDYRYAEYADIFIKMKNSWQNSSMGENEILAMLKKSRKKIVSIFNEKMKNNFVREFNEHNLNIKMPDQTFWSELFDNDNIKKDCLERFRIFEETVLNQKPLKGS